MGAPVASSLIQQQAQARAAGGYINRQTQAPKPPTFPSSSSSSSSSTFTSSGGSSSTYTSPSSSSSSSSGGGFTGLRPRVPLPRRGFTPSSASAPTAQGYAPYSQSQAPGAQAPGAQTPSGYPTQDYQQQGYPQQDQSYQQTPQQQQPYAQDQSAQGAGYQQPSTPRGALEFYNESRKLRGLPALPPDAGSTDKEIANYIMQRMEGDEDRRPTFEETMYAVLVLSAQAASRLGEAAAAQAMVQAAEQWKQEVLQNRARARQQASTQTRVGVFSSNSRARVQAETQKDEGESEESEDTGDIGWGDLGETFEPGTRTLLTVIGAFGLAWGGLCLWKNRKKKA